MPQSDLTEMGLEELSRLLGKAGADSPDAQQLRTEFMRRQTAAQVSAAEAQVSAANAAEKAANYIRYLMWSVILLAVSIVGILLAIMVVILLTTTVAVEG